MLSSLVKLARPSQWLKNGILLAPLIFAGEMTHETKLLTAVFAVAIFCLLSSAIYIFNDIIDREKDRLHPLKKERPIAAGRLSVATATTAMMILIAACRIVLGSRCNAGGYQACRLAV